jgi:hypothetical protein
VNEMDWRVPHYTLSKFNVLILFLLGWLLLGLGVPILYAFILWGAAVVIAVLNLWAWYLVKYKGATVPT